MRGAIIDLDGTVYRSTTPVTGAIEGITTLREASVEVAFVSNTSTKSRDTCLERLRRIGVEADRDAIITSASVTASYLAETCPGERVLAIGEDALIIELHHADVPLTDDPDDADILVVGKDRSFDYDTLTRGLRALDEETRFVATNRDRTSPTEDGIVPGAGALVDAIAAATGREPDLVAGKPHDPIIEATLGQLGTSPSACLVIGDNVATDVAMGSRAGMTTVLVGSGVENREDDGNGKFVPDYRLESMASLDEVLGATDHP